MHGSESDALKETAKLSAAQLKILGVLGSGPSYVSAIAQETQVGVETVRRNLIVLKRLGYVTNWIHTFNEGSLTNIAVSAWRLLTEEERMKGRITPNRNRKALTTLNAKIRHRFSRTRELHQLMMDQTGKPRSL